MGRSSPEQLEPAGLLYPADVSSSPHLDEAISWVTTEEVQPTDPLAGRFDHAAWIDEAALATVSTVAARSIADDIARHPLVEATTYDDLEVLYVRAPSLLHADVQLLTAAALASRVPAIAPTQPAAVPQDEVHPSNALFVVGALGLVALIIAAFTVSGWWTSRAEDEAPLDFGDVAAESSRPDREPVGAIADPPTTAARSDATEPPATAEAAALEVDRQATLASATAALGGAGYVGISARYVDDVLVLEGVMPTSGLGSGYFSQLDEITALVAGIDGVERVSTRLYLRGDDARLRSQLRVISETTPIGFPSGGADLSPASRAGLQDVAAAILANPGLRVLVAGHTDASGDPQANAQLSAARAAAVIEELVRLGVPATRLQPVAYGELFPDGAGTEAENRRVEFEVAP